MPSINQFKRVVKHCFFIYQNQIDICNKFIRIFKEVFTLLCRTGTIGPNHYFRWSRNAKHVAKQLIGQCYFPICIFKQNTFLHVNNQVC